MGNQLLKNYETDRTNQAEGGPFLKWKILIGRHRERPHHAASLFVFEKARLDGVLGKRDAEYVIELLRRDCLNLQKLRHPNILPLIEPLVEDKVSLAFATRPVSQTLAGLIASTLNDKAAQPTNGDVPLEIKAGLLDVCEALLFLHEDARLCHLGLCPTSIFLSPQGAWYLGGLAYATPVGQSVGGSSFLKQFPCEFRFDRPSNLSGGNVPLSDPNLAYCAPEMSSKLPMQSQASDIYSLGLLLLQLGSPQFMQPISLMGNFDKGAHQSQTQRLLASVRSMKLSPDFQSLLLRMLDPDPMHRATIQEVIQSPFLNNAKVKALKFIDTLLEKSDIQKSQFLFGFRSLMERGDSEFSTNHRLLKNRILPALTNLFGKSNLYPSLIPNFLQVVKKVCTPQDFQEICWLKFKPLLTAQEIQIDTVNEIISNLNYLIDLSTDEMVQKDFVPFIIKCLGIAEPSIQYRLLDSLSKFVKRFEFQLLTSTLLPRLVSLLLDPHSSSKIRIKALDVLSQISNSFDRSVIIDQILGSIRQLQQLDQNPLVALACGSLLRELSRILGTKLTAIHVLPIFIPFLVGDNLNELQFDELLNLKKDMMTQIEEVQRKYYKGQADASRSVQSVLSSQESSDHEMIGHTKRYSLEVNNIEALLAACTTAKTEASSFKPLKENLPSQNEIALIFDGLLNHSTAGVSTTTIHRETDIISTQSASSLLDLSYAYKTPMLPSTLFPSLPQSSQSKPFTHLPTVMHQSNTTHSGSDSFLCEKIACGALPSHLPPDVSHDGEVVVNSLSNPMVSHDNNCDPFAALVYQISPPQVAIPSTQLDRKNLPHSYPRKTENDPFSDLSSLF